MADPSRRDRNSPEYKECVDIETQMRALAGRLHQLPKELRIPVLLSWYSEAGAALRELGVDPQADAATLHD
jgi:hypothetical protein